MKKQAMCGHVFVIPAFPRQREEECHKFKASLISTVYSRLARATNIARHHLRKQPPKHTDKLGLGPQREKKQYFFGMGVGVCMYVCVLLCEGVYLHVCTLEGQTTCVYIKIRALGVIRPVHTLIRILPFV